MGKGEVLDIARQYAAAVRDKIETDAVFLYGSHAKGTATEDSDIDIAIVVDRIPGDYLNTMAMLWGLTRFVSQEIEPVLLTKEDAYSGFLDTVQRTGIAV